jgi:hypothetical protein
LCAAARGPLADALKHFTPMDTITPLLRKARPEKVGILNIMGYLDMKLTLAGDMLVKVDRASMAVALEGPRLPPRRYASARFQNSSTAPGRPRPIEEIAEIGAAAVAPRLHPLSARRSGLRCRSTSGSEAAAIGVFSARQPKPGRRLA